MIESPVERSPERRAFAHFLRTGITLPKQAFVPLEAKFNPYHDPRNGQFTFSPYGPRPRGAGFNGSGKRASPPKLIPSQGQTASSTQSNSIRDGVYRPDDDRASFQLAAVEPEPPRGIGSNSGRMTDPMTLEQAFPGLATIPGGSILAVADSVFSISSPMNETTTAASLAYSNALIADIKRYDPTYEYASAFPETLSSQIRQINDLRWDRAVAIYRETGDAEPLQIETIRYLQQRTDAAYEIALKKARSGRLVPVPTLQMSIGNEVDAKVREEFRELVAIRGIVSQRDQPVRINSREYDSSGNDLTYTRPNSRIGNVAIDVTISPKTSKTRQVRGFFLSDFKPKAAVIVRPSQLGGTYIIKRPER